MEFSDITDSISRFFGFFAEKLGSFTQYLDEDIIQNPMYWLLTGAAEFALMLGFKSQEFWSTDISMSLWSKVLVLSLLPVCSYLVFMKIK